MSPVVEPKFDNFDSATRRACERSHFFEICVIMVILVNLRDHSAPPAPMSGRVADGGEIGTYKGENI
jgi:hypothetical protein